MLGLRLRHSLIAFAIGLLPLLFNIAAKAASAEDALAKCDSLASDPYDPGRYAAGVTDEQFAPGAAVDACRAAVDANPTVPRAWFELGRSYWIAERDTEAFAAFVKAATMNYAPSMKYIGDAYRDGRGLPAGVQQNPDTALAWYEKALAAGYRQAAASIQDLSAQIASSTFDPTLFQNPNFMKIMYSGDFSSINDPTTLIAFFAYTKAFTDELGGTNIFFMDLDCKGMVTALGSAINGLGQLFGYLQALQNTDNPLAAIIGASLISAFTQDQGQRDAVILMHTYKCNNPITQKIVANVIGSYQKLPAIIEAFKNSNSSPGYSSSNGGVPLYEQRISPLYWGVIAGNCVARPVAACNRVQQLISSGAYDVIECNYGPINSDGTGYQDYVFWHSKVPDDPTSYDIPGDDPPFLMLGKLALSKCPSTAGQAEPIFQASRLSQ
jgi:hypothetical protein